MAVVAVARPEAVPAVVDEVFYTLYFLLQVLRDPHEVSVVSFRRSTRDSLLCAYFTAELSIAALNT